MSKRILQGVVLSDVCDKTVIVRVERRVMHPVYKKFITHSKKYAAHDEHNRFRTGDTVQIEESRPISKRKHWVVLGGPADASAGYRGGRPGGDGASAETPAEPAVEPAQGGGASA
jgi:small subunit ribosomal protein S17